MRISTWGSVTILPPLQALDTLVSNLLVQYFCGQYDWCPSLSLNTAVCPCIVVNNKLQSEKSKGKNVSEWKYPAWSHALKFDGGNVKMYWCVFVAAGMNQNVPSEYPACNDRGRDREFDRVPWKQQQLQLYFQDSSLSAELMYNSYIYIYGADILHNLFLFLFMLH